jgi:F-type H+-transporting ATPase subunit delta
MSRVIVGIKDIVDRYVAAIIEAASDLGKNNEVTKDFNSLRSLLSSSPDLVDKIACPIFNVPTKTKAVEVIAKHLKLSDLMKNFILLLMKYNRLSILDVIVDDFFVKQNQANGISNISVILAAEVDEKTKKNIQKKLTSIIDGELQIDYQFDPSIKGGAIIKCGSLLFDASIEGKLGRLKKETNEQILNMQ